MKIARFEHHHEIRQGVVEGDEVDLLAPSGTTRTGEIVNLADIKLLAPVCPPNVIALGLNYQQHAAESAMELPERPLVFLKATTSVTDPNEPIILPHLAPTEVDYEAELCLVIGKTARNVSEDEALDYVMGYTCGNDVSARDCQIRLDGQWARGKSFDTFCPLGPWIETELDPDNCGIRSRLNGHVMQDSNTSDLIFNCRHLVSYLSHNMTLLPGTVIMTGTPEGVGFVRQPPVYMRAGDVIEIEIDGIGVLRNEVKADEA
jgi:2-keto-4-pentenoate hydratase/2-oxohepta-3-ene-1,7-dioic acid hydratase in catechol pathway